MLDYNQEKLNDLLLKVVEFQTNPGDLEEKIDAHRLTKLLSQMIDMLNFLKTNLPNKQENLLPTNGYPLPKDYLLFDQQGITIYTRKVVSESVFKDIVLSENIVNVDYKSLKRAQELCEEVCRPIGKKIRMNIVE